ncbi:hypothetical protein GARC_4188 [Paraglaciecola arctica BSs20135]|uniref:Uncharacterized protein n=1 Tax=Paraglaciecola arctica BSs20135 TaxID=493475 RepID=K6ZCH5_9ALTE|nr:hypothetical protein GARC_4188 [Paraglaciecola arctica BSs20135]
MVGFLRPVITIFQRYLTNKLDFQSITATPMTSSAIINLLYFY